MNHPPALAAMLLAIPLAGCISSSPPAPPVRFFDPTPDAPAPPVRSGLSVRVDSPPHLGREFVVRVGPREVVFDARHSWIDEPRELVAAAIDRALGQSSAVEGLVRVGIELFEVDLQDGPRAHVRLLVHGPSQKAIDESEPARDGTPESFAAAMSIALGRAAHGVAAALGPGR